MELKKRNSILTGSFLCTVVLGIIFHFDGIVFYIILGLFIIVLISYFILSIKERKRNNKEATE